MKKFMMTAHFEDGTVDLCTVMEDKNPTNGCTFYRVIPADGNTIIKDEDFVACDDTKELRIEMFSNYRHCYKMQIKEMNS